MSGALFESTYGNIAQKNKNPQKIIRISDPTLGYVMTMSHCQCVNMKLKLVI